MGVACVDVATMDHADVVNNRCCELGEWIRLDRS